MTTPTIDDLKEFLGIIARLDKFEAMCRQSRGYGEFNETELPFQAYQRAVQWLQKIINEGVVTSPSLYLDNMALRGRVAYLQSELHAAAGQFLFYADNHAKKNPPDKAKAKTNADWAKRMMRAAWRDDFFGPFDCGEDL